MTQKLEKDWAGIKFKLMKELGECIDMIYIKENIKENSRQVFFKTHDKTDGSGAFAQILEKEEGIEIPELPTLKKINQPNIFKRLLLAYKHVKRQSPITYPWKKYNSDITGKSKAISYSVFSKEESLALDNYAKENGMNSNSIFLWAVDQVSKRDFLNDPDHKRVWMVPVNMRMPGFEKVKNGNFVTTLTVHLKDEKPKGVFDQIRSMMKSGIIWGGWIIANTPKYIGEKNLRKMTKNLKSPYIGLCSNLGQWPPKEIQTDNRWIVASPVTKFCPIASVVMKWQDSYSISIQLHPSLEASLEDSIKFISDWKKEISNLTGIKFDSEITTLPWSELKESIIEF